MMDFEMHEMLCFGLLALLWLFWEAFQAVRRWLKRNPWNFVPNETPGCFMTNKGEEE